MRKCILLISILAIAVSANQTQAQVAEAGSFLTVGAIRQGLNEALVGVQDAIVTAGSEGRALGNSLQANVQNVLADIDARFAKRLDYTLDRLEGSERQFAADARDLIYRARAASKVLSGIIGDESRRTIGEADIAAYNASYSLPCRTQIPRIVYWTPTKSVVRGEEIIVSLHGNYLNFGEAKAEVDGKPATLATQNDRVISVKIPREMVQKITEVSSMAIEISGLNKRVMTPHSISWLFGCGENMEAVRASSALIELVPRLHYRVQAEVWATYNEWSAPFVHQSGNLNRHDDDCDHDENVSFQACVPAENMRTVEGHYGVKSKSGPSSFGPATKSGSNCILFNGRLKGSGYNWVVGIKNCQGSAWLDADWNVVAQRLDTKETARFHSDDVLPIGQYSHAINHAQSPIGENWKWRYITKVDQMRGSQVLATETLTDGRIDNGNGWISAMKDGVLTVSLPAED